MTRQTQYTIDLPLFIIYNKKGDKFYINLNQYRNTHFQTLNKVKILFEEQVSPKLLVLPKIKKLSITYILFIGSNRQIDLSNVCSIADKFFCDTLTNNHIIEDDNISVLQDIKYQFGTIDKNNPRVEAILNIIEFKEEEPMRVTLVETEINEALTNYVRTHMPALTGEPKIELKAGRGEDGFTAEVNFVLNPTVTSEENQQGLSVPNTPQQRAAARTSEIAKQVGDTPLVTAVQPTPTPVSEVFKDLVPPTSAVAIENNIQEASSPLPSDPPIVSAPSAVAAPKSLFANLGKPQHDTPNN